MDYQQNIWEPLNFLKVKNNVVLILQNLLNKKENFNLAKNIKKSVANTKISDSDYKTRICSDIDVKFAKGLMKYAKKNGFVTRSNLINYILYNWANDSDFYDWIKKNN